MEKTLKKFGEAIKKHEGWFAGSRSFRNNNPGNLRWSPSQEGMRDGFAFFNTYEEGWKALLHDLRIKFSGQSITAVRADSTILHFFQVYAPSGDNNNPKIYAEFVAGQFGVPISTRLCDLVEMSVIELENKIPNVVPNKAFSLLVFVDDEIDEQKARLMVSDTGLNVLCDSLERLKIAPYVAFVQLPIWDNERIKKIARNIYDMDTFQAVVAVYKKGKFRQSLGQMNEQDKEFGVLINHSFEDPDSVGPLNEATVLTHELMHAFKFLLGMEYVKSVHETPNDFKDDFESMGDNVKKLYYIQDQKDETPTDVEEKEMETKQPLWLSSVNPTKLSTTVKGVLNGFVPLIAIALGFVTIDLTVADYQQFVDSIPNLIMSIWAAIAALQIVFGGGRKIVLAVIKAIKR